MYVSYDKKSSYGRSEWNRARILVVSPGWYNLSVTYSPFDIVHHNNNKKNVAVYCTINNIFLLNSRTKQKYSYTYTSIYVLFFNLYSYGAKIIIYFEVYQYCCTWYNIYAPTTRYILIIYTAGTRVYFCCMYYWWYIFFYYLCMYIYLLWYLVYRIY